MGSKGGRIKFRAVKLENLKNSFGKPNVLSNNSLLAGGIFYPICQLLPAIYCTKLLPNIGNSVFAVLPFSSGWKEC